MIALGGKSIYGAAVGILMLDARFPRILGDMGNAQTWPFPVHYRIVRGASPDLIVRRGAEGMLGHFIDAARDLLADGVDGITTNCGFLSLFQDDLTDALGVPVVTSSLMQVEMVNRTLPKGKRAGILTISASTLTEKHLASAHVPPGTPIGSTESGTEFTRVILGDEQEMDIDLACKDNVEAAKAISEAHEDLGAMVLECSNMCPYAREIQRETKLPTYSMVDLVTWFQSGLMPAAYLD